MERLAQHRKNTSGLSSSALRIWGMILLAGAIAGRSIIQNRLFGLGVISSQELLALMEADSKYMFLATIALILQGAGCCATVVYALLLCEGVVHTKDLKSYALRVAGVAALAEIPYNLAICGRLLDFSGRNPVFGVLLGMLMLWVFGKYPGKNGQAVLAKVLITLGCMLWCAMLNVDSGICMILLTATMWAFRKKTQLRAFAVAMAALICSVVSPFYMVAPLSCLLLHFYNGEQGEQNRTVNYLSYPVMLLVIYLIGSFVKI